MVVVAVAAAQEDQQEDCEREVTEGPTVQFARTIVAEVQRAGAEPIPSNPKLVLALRVVRVLLVAVDRAVVLGRKPCDSEHLHRFW